MCGITGFIDYKKKFTIKNLELITKKLIHRGPDYSNCLLENNKNFNVGLGHTRLSIVDLSNNGNQPMISSDKKKVIIFNGEIYNFKEIKKKIIEKNTKFKFKGNSDTEIFLEAIVIFGLVETLNLVSGMFAFALYDKCNKNIYLVRDRFGQKPLYYSNSIDNLIFSSEVKSLKEILQDKRIDEGAIKDFFLYNYIKGKKTIFENVKSVEPGSILKYNIDNKEITENTWKKEVNFFKNENKSSLNKIDNLLTSSIEEQTDCEVPYGIFLSGGVDSSLIAAIAQKKLSRNIKTFTISFKNKNYSEGKFANKIAEYLKTDHYEHVFDENEMIGTIKLFFELNDQPFADVSKLPLILLSKISSDKIKIALSGDGADEIFGGYNRYLWVKRLNLISLNQRKIIKKLLKILNLNTLSSLFKPYNFLSKQNFIAYPDEKLKRLKNIISFENLENFYELSQIKWHDQKPLNFLNDFENIDYTKNNNNNNENIEHFINNMMKLDQKDYLINNCMVKSDRATMMNGLELRLPFLNDKVVDFGNNLKLEEKIKNGKGKLILRNLLSSYLPKKLFDRDKTGFHVPLGSWFKNELREIVEDTFNNKKIRKIKFLDHDLINKIWQDHLLGKSNNQNKIWTILVLEMWLIKNYE
jgi:asparagine synthase (glutamine-hydrolysing)